MPDWVQNYDAIWHVDFEYRQDLNHHSIPVSMHACEQLTGIRIELWGDQLRALRRAPFDTGRRSLMVAYAANAELSCFLALGWPFPCNVLDIYVETIVAINGRSDVWEGKGRPGLLGALELWGLPSRARQEKDRMRDLILSKSDYTNEEKIGIQKYNREDVDDTMAMLNIMASTIDLPRALLRGRYMGAVACMEWCGIPIDAAYLALLQENWDDIRLHYIQRDDEFELYEGTSFREQRLWDLVERMGWDWPLTSTGRPE